MAPEGVVLVALRDGGGVGFGPRGGAVAGGPPVALGEPGRVAPATGQYRGGGGATAGGRAGMRQGGGSPWHASPSAKVGSSPQFG